MNLALGHLQSSGDLCVSMQGHLRETPNVSMFCSIQVLSSPWDSAACLEAAAWDEGTVCYLYNTYMGFFFLKKVSNAQS